MSSEWDPTVLGSYTPFINTFFGIPGSSNIMNNRLRNKIFTQLETGLLFQRLLNWYQILKEVTLYENLKHDQKFIS